MPNQNYATRKTKLGRVARSAAVLGLTVVAVSCGQTYRPVATPVIPPTPNPAFAKAAFVVSENGPQNSGTSNQIDVSGDTSAAVAKTGRGPVYATLTPDLTRVYVANQAEDTISVYPPGTPNSVNLNPVITISLPAGSAPDFVTTAQNSVVFSANYGAGTVAAISTATNAITQIISLSAGAQPVAMSETPNALKLYVANQANGSTSGSVSSINPVDNSLNAPVANAWVSPVWVVSRTDSARAYVLDAGAGTVSAINTSTDTVLPGPVSVGAGANFMFYDSKRNRIYVTNPAAGNVSVLDVSSDPPALLATDCLTTGVSAPCPATFSPVSVTVVPDGSNAYVASYQIGATCGTGVAAACLTSQVSVINATSNSVSAVIPLGSVTVDPTNPTGCGPPGPVTTITARFRLSIAAAGDSSRVYVANCDAGGTTVISAVPTSSDPYPANTVITTILAPVSAFPPSATSPGVPPRQNPVFAIASP